MPAATAIPTRAAARLACVRDVAELGLGELDVGAEHPTRGALRGADLRAETGRLGGRRRRRGRRRSARTGSGGGVGRRVGRQVECRVGVQRFVQGGLPSIVLGDGAMIAGRRDIPARPGTGGVTRRCRTRGGRAGRRRRRSRRPGGTRDRADPGGGRRRSATASARARRGGRTARPGRAGPGCRRRSVGPAGKRTSASGIRGSIARTSRAWARAARFHGSATRSAAAGRRPVRLARESSAAASDAAARRSASRRRALDPHRADPVEQVAQLRQPRRVAPEPADEPGLDALDVGQGPIREVRRAAVGQLAVADRGVEQLPRPVGEREPAIELREAALFEIVHPAASRRVPMPTASMSGGSAVSRPGGTARRFRDTSADGTRGFRRRRDGSGPDRGRRRRGRRRRPASGPDRRHRLR